VIELPRRQRQLYELLFGKGDVSISQLYVAMRGFTGDGGIAVAFMQRHLSPYITLLNRSLAAHGMKVEPGALKNTYRLIAVSK